MTTEETKKPLIVDPAKIKTIVVDDHNNASGVKGPDESGPPVPPQLGDPVEGIPPQLESIPPQLDQPDEAVPPQR